MKFGIILEFDPEAGSFSAVCPELPGCASVGDTEGKRGEILRKPKL
jgi:predicted RNase H-like HicB family nuclease